MAVEKIYSIDEISKIVAPIADDFGIRKISLFGSYARGEATLDSDLDFHVIDRGSLRGFFRQVILCSYVINETKDVVAPL